MLLCSCVADAAIASIWMQVHPRFLCTSVADAASVLLCMQVQRRFLWDTHPQYTPVEWNNLFMQLTATSQLDRWSAADAVKALAGIVGEPPNDDTMMITAIATMIKMILILMITMIMVITPIFVS